jgi:aminoglycoside phosphotransferase (APT) family kinase protein
MSDKISLILNRIHQEFPDLKWDNFEYINHGWDHDVVILNDKTVFRFPNSPEYKTILKDEVRLMAYLKNKINITIPQYKYVSSDHSFAGYEIIPGDSLTVAKFSSIPSGDRSNITKQLASFFTSLHMVELNEIKKFNIPYEKPIEYDVRDLSMRFLKPNLDKQDFVNVMRVIEEVDQLTEEQCPQVLVHNDISPKHIIWDAENKKVGIIDFSDRSIGDPALDFAELYLYGKTFVDQVYELYEGAKYEKFLGRAKVYMRRTGVSLMAHSFKDEKVSFKEAKKIFDLSLNC